MHYAISNFQHRDVEDMWPPGAQLEAYLDLGLEDAKLDDLFKSVEIERYGGKVISELCWWLDTWFRKKNWTGNGWSLQKAGRHAQTVFRALETALHPHLTAAFPKRDLARLDWEEREAFICNLPLKDQLLVRAEVTKIADSCASQDMARLAKKIPVSKLIGMRKLRAMVRPGVNVTLNGTTPTSYTRQLSTYNVWLMRMLSAFPNVRYQQGALSVVDANYDGQFEVTFNDGKKYSSTAS